MLDIILSHEVRELRKSPATLFMLWLLAAAMVFGIYNGTRAVERQNKSAVVAVADEAAAKQRVLDQLVAYERFTAERGIPRVFAPVNHAPPRPGQSPQGTNAGAVGGELVKEVAILPPTGLAAFAVGQMDLQRNYTLVDMKNKFNMSDNFEIENPLNLMTGTFDISFVVIFLLPVFIIALTYDMLSGEKESGTLALAMTQPVSLRTFMAGKLLSRIALLMLVIVIIGLYAMLFSGSALGVLDDPDAWVRFGLFLLATFIYSLFWFGLGVFVNSLNKSSETNVTILSGAWLLIVVVLPALISLTATTAYPAPSRMELKVAMRDASIAAEKAEDDTTKAYYTDHVEMLPEKETETYLTVFLARQDALEKAVEPVFAQFRGQLERQEAIVGWFQLLSPAVAMQNALNEISGNSTDRYNAYMDKVFAFQKEWKQFFTPRYLQREIMDSSMYDDFPKFEYGKEAPYVVLGRILLSAFAVLLISIGMNAYAFLRLRRFGVRENS